MKQPRNFCTEVILRMARLNCMLNGASTFHFKCYSLYIIGRLRGGGGGGMATRALASLIISKMYT